MRDILGIIVCNMHDDLVPQLTANRTLGSIPFGGRYRMIDFALSNMTNSGIYDVGLVPSKNYQSLMNHVGNGQEWDMSRKNGGLSILPPYAGERGVYRGRMEALYGVREYIKASDAKTVVLSDSDVVANIDLRPVIKQHEESGADITLVYKRSEIFRDKKCAALFFNEYGKLLDLYLNPELDGIQNIYLDIAIIKKPLLDELIAECASKNEHSFVNSVLMQKKSVLNIRGYQFDGYCNKLTGLRNYLDSNLALLNPEVRKSLFPMERPIYTRVRDEVSARYGENAKVSETLVTDGCSIDGEVEKTVVFRGATIEKGAKVKGCVLMHNTFVGEGCDLQWVITDKNVVIPAGTHLAGSPKYPLYIPKDTVL
ncbi:MAG: glucose-1-phosphate adenylyltransferase subunit GlgD [Oscillospiraceae bacterium]|nr:glucose-1-phosphate adenylyltransferase subunit GlgD [Oscillospiraceae bacterium]